MNKRQIVEMRKALNWTWVPGSVEERFPGPGRRQRVRVADFRLAKIPARVTRVQVFSGRWAGWTIRLWHN